MQLTVWAKVQNGENMWKFQPEQMLRTKKKCYAIEKMTIAI